ncbi:MAG: hypothetical protein ACRDU8_11215, partial [Egibacteraceae bacterium]
TSATAGPTSSYAVATTALLPGDRVGPGDVELVPIDLPDAQRANAFDQLQPLYDTTVVEALNVGELLQAGSVQRISQEPGARTLSFPVEGPRAVSGKLVPNEAVDILATYGTGQDSCTERVVADARLVEATKGSGGLVGEDGYTVTVALTDAEQELELAHAAAAGVITIARTTGAGEQDAPERFCTPVPSDG